MTEEEGTRQLCERSLPIAARCDLQGAVRPTLLLHTFVLAHTKGEARVAVKLGACGSGSSEKQRHRSVCALATHRCPRRCPGSPP